MRPVTVIGETPPLVEIPPQVAVKPVIALPPLFDGGVKAMLATVLPAVAVPMIGAPGTVRGVTFVGVDAVPGPTALIAVTVQL